MGLIVVLAIIAGYAGLQVGYDAFFRSMDGWTTVTLWDVIISFIGAGASSILAACFAVLIAGYIASVLGDVLPQIKCEQVYRITSLRGFAVRGLSRGEASTQGEALIVISGAAESCCFTWIDEQGKKHTEQVPSSDVRVVVYAEVAPSVTMRSWVLKYSWTSLFALERCSTSYEFHVPVGFMK